MTGESVLLTSPALAVEGPPTWTCIVQLQLPTSGSYVVHPTSYERLIDQLKPYGPALKIPDDGTVQVAFGVSALNYPEAEKAASAPIAMVTRTLNLDHTDIIGKRILRNDELQARLDAIGPAFPECVGVGEAAGMLGVSKQRVHQLAGRNDFPQPVLRLRATPVWREADIRQFALTRARSASAGRRAAARA